MRTFIAGAASTGLSVASGCHDQEIGLARELDMAHLALVGEREHVAVDAILAQRLQGERGHEAGAGVGDHAAHRGAALAQPADEFEGFEGRDAARDDQQDPLAVQHGGEIITTPGWRKYRRP
jgi:hypothetical protein